MSESMMMPPNGMAPPMVDEWEPIPGPEDHVNAARSHAEESAMWAQGVGGIAEQIERLHQEIVAAAQESKASAAEAKLAARQAADTVMIAAEHVRMQISESMRQLTEVRAQTGYEDGEVKKAQDIMEMMACMQRDTMSALNDVVRELRAPKTVRVTKRDENGAISEAVSEPEHVAPVGIEIEIEGTNHMEPNE